MDAPSVYGPPPPAAVYPDFDTAVAAIQGYAQRNGYAFFKRDVKPRRMVFVCDRFGKAPPSRSAPVHESKRRKGGSKKCGCTMKVALKLDVDSNQ